MLTYEQLISLLIEALEQQQINIVHTQELVDVHTMGRSLYVTCLAPNVDKHGNWTQPPLRAVISLQWPAELTVVSLHRTPMIDMLNQLITRRQELQREYLFGFELTYYLPLSQAEQAAAEPLFQTEKVIDLFADQFDIDNNLAIHAVMRYGVDQEPMLTQLTVTRQFPILRLELDLVEEATTAIADELHEMLPRLYTAFPADPDEPGLDPQLYLRPPIA
jgi:hypothetical protein